MSNGNHVRDGDRTRDQSENTRREFLQVAGAGIGALALGATADPAAASSHPPRLHTEGKWIRDPNGNDVKLRGVAPADPHFYTLYHPKSWQEVYGWAVDQSRGWYSNTVRIPVTLPHSLDHFSSTRAYVDQVLRPLVDFLGNRGVYAMIDFHLIRPYTAAATDDSNDHTRYPDDLQRDFWGVVAPEFAADTHVVFELFNEPTEPAHWSDDEQAWLTWRNAAQPWVDLIRSHAPDTPIVIGSPRWTSVPHMAPKYPFQGGNLVYSGHIYPGGNGQPEEFDPVYGQPATEVPIFITEFGWDPRGDARIDKGTTSGWGEGFRHWVENAYPNMAWTGWCFDDSWAPTMFDSPGSGANEPWTLKDDYDQQGWFFKQWLEETETSTADPGPNAPVVDSFVVTNNSNGGWAKFDVDWAVSDADGDLGRVTVELRQDGVVAVASRFPSGSAGSGTLTLEEQKGSGTYDVVLTVTDSADHGTTRVETVTA